MPSWAGHAAFVNETQPQKASQFVYRRTTTAAASATWLNTGRRYNVLD